jgi:hypothetical protein
VTTITVIRGEDGKLTGFGEKDRRAYVKFRKTVDELEAGEMFTVSVWFPRNPKLHRLHFALINTLFEQQEQFEEPDDLRRWLYVGAGHADFLPGPKGKMVAIPKSVAYDKIDDAAFSELHMKVIDFMRSHYCQAFLWPHLEEDKRGAMIESLVEEFEGTA